MSVAGWSSSSRHPCVIAVVAVQHPDAGVVGDEPDRHGLHGCDDDGVPCADRTSVGLDHLEGVPVQVHGMPHRGLVGEGQGWLWGQPGGHGLAGVGRAASAAAIASVVPLAVVERYTRPGMHRRRRRPPETPAESAASPPGARLGHRRAFRRGPRSTVAPGLRGLVLVV